MMQIVRRWTVVFSLALVVASAAIVTAMSQPTYAQGQGQQGGSGGAAGQGTPRSGEPCGGILTLPPWYRGLTDANCNILSPNEVGGLPTFIWTIALNVIEMLMQVVGYITIGYLIFGGFKYMTAQGEASKIVQAKDTIRNALIGLLIAIFSVAIVNFAAGAIT